MKNLKVVFLTLIFQSSILSASADNTNFEYRLIYRVSPTNAFWNSNGPIGDVSYVYRDSGPDFWSHASDIIAKKGSYLTGDKFGPVNQLVIIRQRDRARYSFYSQQNDMGRSIFEGTLGDSSRDIIAEIIPTDKLEDDAKSEVFGFFGSFFKGSIGNTDEERLNTVSAVPQASSLDKKTWEISEDKGLLDYGIKPFRKSPYIYGTVGVGHVNGKPVIFNIRLYSVLTDHDTGNPKIEISTALYSTKYSQVILGGAIYPLSMNKNGHGPACSARYERMLFKDSKNKFFSLGISSNEKETYASIMLHTGW